jgi:hypothetical protein
LGAILAAVATAVPAGLASISDKGRPGFAQGLGAGARSEIASQQASQAAAQQQEIQDNDIKMKNFDAQVRLAELNNQDLKQQGDTQAQQDAHQAAQLHLRQVASDAGLNFTTLPNTAAAVKDNLVAQTGQNGTADIPPMTHGDANTIYMMANSDDPATQTKQMDLYKALAPAFGLPALPNGAQFVPNKSLNFLTNKINGFDLNGNTISHDNLPAAISSLQIQRDNLAKQQGATPDQLKAIDNTLNIYKANLDALDTHSTTVADQASAREQARQIAIEQEKGNQQRLTNSDKPQKADTNFYEGTDASGNPIAGTATELQNAGVSQYNKMPALTQTQTLAARELTAPNGLFSTAKQQITALNQAGQLGAVASRWNNFWAKKGMDADQQAFRDTLGLISTKLMQAHMGNRGGKDAMEHFANLVPENATPATLMSALNTEYGYVNALAKRPKASAPTSAPTGANNGQ